MAFWMDLYGAVTSFTWLNCAFSPLLDTHLGKITMTAKQSGLDVAKSCEA